MSLGRVMLAACTVLAATGCTFIEGLAPQPDDGPGANHEAYLAGSADRIVVGLDHEPGAGFDQTTPAERQFVTQLERITLKEVEVRSNAELQPLGGQATYELGDLREMHREHRDVEPDEDTEVIHALFVKGSYEEDVAGLAFAERGLAVFEAQIETTTCPNDEPVCRGPCPGQARSCERWTEPTVREWRVTRSVAIHEAGHLFGLVGSPLGMVEHHEMRGDPRPETPAAENRSHSANSSSVMYWTVEDPQRVDGAGEAEVPHRFGHQDVRDARALQTGRAS